MFEPRESKLCHKRIPRGNLQKPLRGTIAGEQSDSSRTLLAYYADERANLCQNLRQVPKVRHRHQTTVRGTHPVGIRYQNRLFAQWGLDIMGPFSVAVKQLTFIVVDIDYFTKWVEAEALATITEKNIQSFVWKNIICRYGIPRVLVSNNGKQFDNSAFRDFCSELGIKNYYSSPVHP